MKIPQADWKTASKGDQFGPSWTNRITGGYGGDRRVEYILPDSAYKGKNATFKHSFIIESSCNGMFGVPWDGDTISAPDMNRYFTLASADLVVPNLAAWDLMADFQTLREIGDNLPGNTPLQNLAITTANEVMNVFHKLGSDGIESQDVVKASIEKARKVCHKVFGSLEGVYDDKPAKIWAIGHCHIDTAWLWPYSVTQQKVARSWSTQLDLIERYPEFRFAASSAQQYKWLEQQYPLLFKGIQKAVKKGRFEVVGGAWVEHDSNMPSGEALVRQHLSAQRFFQSRFNVKSTVAWLPDSFGLSGALPQILRQSGMKYFFTQKLSWNNINTFPHSTFNWVGVDGTQVLCHMTPVETYTAQASVGDIMRGLQNHKNLESSSTSLLVFGNGDGGGGPLPKMLENLRRIRATANTHREMPPVVLGNTIDDFFEYLQKGEEVYPSQGRALPNWHGELYLEFHRGTYTSHGSIKKGNRHAERLLLIAEMLSTIASVRTSYEYPKKTLEEMWEDTLLNQFHDVLPGSAIGMVYDDAEVIYKRIMKRGHSIIEAALKALGNASVNSSSPVPLNTTPFARREVIGNEIFEFDGFGAGRRVDCLQADAVTTHTNGKDHFVLRNGEIQLTLSSGRITSLIGHGRELIVPGETGGLVLFEDRPNYWDAWDVEIHHLETPTLLSFSSVKVVSYGPEKGAVLAQLKWGKSAFDVTISLDAGAKWFTFDAKVDWRERHLFLKFQLPLSLNSPHATYESQFSFVQRPTHKNTSWAQAQFEVCGHRYADLSEYGSGVALLSESKYGFSCLGNVLSISLLRAATAPDAEQDQGKHVFSWGVYPHRGFAEGHVPRAGVIFSSPVLLKGVDVHRMFWVDNAPNVFLETVKRGEDDEEFKDGGWWINKPKSGKSIVVRLYEAYGGHAVASLGIDPTLDVDRIVETNLLEEEEDEKVAQLVQGKVRLQFRAFEIKTIKVYLKDKQRNRDSWVDVAVMC
ncbi:glycoside hydrolase family 38 protein [Mycena floridula]|nr:glycoside hydrolase family 38 protein [Mycena floridula]